MAIVDRERSALKKHQRLTASARRPRRIWPYALGTGVLVLLGVAAAAAIVLGSARASLTVDPNAIARIGLPLGGGKIESVTVVTGPHSRLVPIHVVGNQIWPRHLVPAHERLTIDAVVKRPGWIAWLAGKTDHLRLTLITPSTKLREHYLTIKPGAPLRLRFAEPIRVISYGPPGALRRHVLPAAVSEYSLDRLATAGTISVAAAPRTWETSSPSAVSWFPTGAAAAAVAVPAPGTSILPGTPITLTFNKTVSQVLGTNRPPVSPTTPGTWHTLNSHSIVFKPQGYGYGLGATVTVGLPAGVRLVGASGNGSGTWTVPAGSTARLQQMLALLGYLPLQFNYRSSRGVGLSLQSQEAAAINPPAGNFTWRYGNTPDPLRSMWAPGTSGVMTRGAVMAFENDQGMSTDGVPGPQVWKALIGAVLAGHRSSFGYTFVMVSESSPESLTLWHNGQTEFSVPVNTGIASAPTALGTYPVFEHIASGTMSGTNPDGSHYSDPGIPFISYFNGGDALHGYYRAQYGFPQSLGCVEMTATDAGRVYPYTPIGTLVHVA